MIMKYCQILILEHNICIRKGYKNLGVYTPKKGTKKYLLKKKIW